MAQAFLNSFGGDWFTAESAGLKPGKINPVAADAMMEEGIDISENETNDVMDFYRQGRGYDYVITVCDGADKENCPVFPGGGKRMHWPFKDPSGLSGDYTDKLEKTRLIRENIKKRVSEFIKNERGNYGR